MHKWTIKEALQIMFPITSKSSKNSLFDEYFKKIRKLSWKEYNKLLDSYHEKINSIPCVDVGNYHFQCPDL